MYLHVVTINMESWLVGLRQVIAGLGALPSKSHTPSGNLSHNHSTSGLKVGGVASTQIKINQINQSCIFSLALKTLYE